ncbi:hypothetical protein D3C80_1609440 [compost metagenome]
MLIQHQNYSSLTEILYIKTKEATALWLGEATEFVEEVTKTGFEVDYVRPDGGFVPLVSPWNEIC